MKKTIKNFFILLILLFVAYIVFLFIFRTDQNQAEAIQRAEEYRMKEETLPAQYEFQGKNGIDAYTILYDQTDVVRDNSGLVSSINGRSVDPKKREFWAFYVNGEMANVGPLDYITKDGDLILWKIETY